MNLDAPRLQVAGLQLRLGDHDVLRGVDLALHAGELVGLIGPNGSGKSTLLRAIAGSLPPDRGHIAIGGENIATDSLAARRRLGFAVDPERLPRLITGRQCLEIVARLREEEQAIADSLGLAGTLGLGPWLDRPVYAYSLGTRQKLAVVIALHGAPSLILLDEVLNGLDPLSAWALKQALRQRTDAGATVLLFIIAVTSTREIGLVRGGLMAIMGTLWIWMAGVILSECIGRTNWSPLSGMTLIAITIFIFIASGIGDSAAIISSVMVGAAACVAMAQATDLMLDLKTGYLVGATPRQQQIGQFLGSWLGPVLVMGLIFLLHESTPLGTGKLSAPQGQALASVINGILGGDVPVQKYIAGAGLGALLSASGIGGLGILVGLGFYLPFNIVVTYSLGTMTRLLVDRKQGPRFSEEVGIPMAAGLIVGEALVGVGNAMYFVFVN